MLRESLGGLPVKNSVLSLLWHRFDSWPRELLHAEGVAKKKKKVFEVTYNKSTTIWLKNIDTI